MVCVFFSCLSINIDMRKKHVAVYDCLMWKAGYDVRVDKKKKDKPVTLTYKACIAIYWRSENCIILIMLFLTNLVFLGLEQCSRHSRNRCYSYIPFRGTCFDTMEYLP